MQKARLKLDFAFEGSKINLFLDLSRHTLQLRAANKPLLLRLPSLSTFAIKTLQPLSDLRLTYCFSCMVLHNLLHLKSLEDDPLHL